MDFLLFIKVLILGLVEGATEFIPVSSTGHLIIVEDWLNYTGDQAKTFSIFIQLGAILAILLLYREKVFKVVRTLPGSQTSQRFALNIIVAFFPAALVGLLTHDWIKAYLFSPLTVAGALVVGGIAILVIERWQPATRIEEVDDLPVLTALWIGVAQVLALFPGVSRSGATILGAYSLGLSRQAATEFSFFLAIPVMFAATLFDLWGSRDILTGNDVPVFAVGFIVSFLSALIVVRAFIAFVSRSDFRPFAWYRIVFGLLLLAYYGFFHR